MMTIVALSILMVAAWAALIAFLVVVIGLLKDREWAFFSYGAIVVTAALFLMITATITLTTETLELIA
jgi:hypothetical protein